jgi:mono/diheme cytochrome c family protein
MFDTISGGRVDKGMPPFGSSSSNPISDEERWNVIAAIYSLGTPVESIESGLEYYSEACAACHGDEGKGDGPRTADIDQDPGDLASIAYWFSNSNKQIFEAIQASDDFHATGTDESDLWSAIDYMRTFSYEYVDALAPFRPIEVATVSGRITNGTTGEPVASEATATLRGFTEDLNITVTLTDTVDDEGRYSFDLTDIPQDWFFRTSIDYTGIDYGSDFGQINFDQPDLDLPVIVYETSTDPDLVNIEQVHIILAFGEDIVDVSEVYVASYDGAAVFVGETGQVEDGTFRISLPDDAEDINFSRGFGSVDSFIPANEMVPVEAGWADTMPLRPGTGTLNLLAQYTLPYDGGASFSHPLNYPTSLVNLVIPDIGVSLENDSGWQDTGQRAMGNNSVSTFALSALPANEILNVNLEGRPRTSSPVPTDLANDNTTEIIVGAAIALLVVLVAIVLIRQWQTVPVPVTDRYLLLEEIAALDDAYDAGEISQSQYQEEREALKAELVEIWDDSDPVDPGSSI